MTRKQIKKKAVDPKTSKSKATSKPKAVRKKAAVELPESFTYHLNIIVRMQYTFSRADLIINGEDDPEPEIREEVLSGLEDELQECLMEGGYHTEVVEILDDSLNHFLIAKC